MTDPDQLEAMVDGGSTAGAFAYENIRAAADLMGVTDVLAWIERVRARVLKWNAGHRDARAAVAEVESLVPGSGARLAAALSRREGSGSGGSGDGGGAGGEQAKPRRRRFGIV